MGGLVVRAFLMTLMVAVVHQQLHSNLLFPDGNSNSYHHSQNTRMMQESTLASTTPVAVPRQLTIFDKVGAGEVNTYQDFVRRHSPERPIGWANSEVPLAVRQALFEARRAFVEKHNSQTKRSWLAAVNHFADYTHEELRAMRGYMPGRNQHSRSTSSTSSTAFLSITHRSSREEQRHMSSAHNLPEEVDWRKLRSSSWDRVQQCGSCWAVASIGALEMHTELNSGNATPLSLNRLVHCVQNPKHCGGTGGCDGATAELAFEYVKHGGIVAESEDTTDSKEEVCEKTTSGLRTVTSGFVRLPSNNGDMLLRAVAQHGPVAVSIDASLWQPYQTGVFDSCPPDAIVDHSVLLIGYGLDGYSGAKTWLLRNSWGRDWGEMGMIRLYRHDVGQTYCGVDKSPEVGLGCDGGPKEVRVCGMCGILLDSAYPLGARLAEAEGYEGREAEEPLPAQHVEQSRSPQHGTTSLATD